MYRLAALWMATSEARMLVHSSTSMTVVTHDVTYWVLSAKNRLPSSLLATARTWPAPTAPTATQLVSP